MIYMRNITITTAKSATYLENVGSMVETATPIIATRINGQAFDLRDRGPLWLVFPYDVDSRFRTEKIFAASIWQLTHILSGTSAP